MPRRGKALFENMFQCREKITSGNWMSGNRAVTGNIVKDKFVAVLYDRHVDFFTFCNLSLLFLIVM
jgi:hypothetical protein